MVDRTDVLLICGGLYHDIDFARLKLLEMLGQHPGVRTRVAEDYANVDALGQAKALVTYTTDVIPTDEQRIALQSFLDRGGRWFALHGTNSVIQIDEKGYASSPRTAPQFMEMLGSQFIAHPPKGPFAVHNAQPEHPLVEGIDTFEVDDELYLVEEHGALDVLLYSQFNGKAMGGFTEREFFSDEPRPIMYIKRHDPGAVLYLNLGHCRSHWDMQPLMDWYPDIERCSWDSDVFITLVERSLRWALA
ncbi:MAG: ThuA domain-containing protein [Lysobacterales bacterium]